MTQPIIPFLTEVFPNMNQSNGLSVIGQLKTKCTMLLYAVLLSFLFKELMIIKKTKSRT